MKLLTPQATQDSTNADVARAVFRIEEYKKIEQEWRMKLANAEADFNETLAKNRKAWEEEELAHKKDIDQRNREINQLEAKKLSMAVPFDILKQGAKEKVAYAEKLLADIRERERKTEELTELLEEKLDSVGEREETVKQEEKRIALKRKGLEAQIESSQSKFAELTEALAKFASERAVWDIEHRRQQEALEMRESSAKSREEAFTHRDRALEEREMRLQDQQGVLQRAWDEFRKMRGY